MGPDCFLQEGCGFHPRGLNSQVFHVISNHHSKTNLCLAGTAELPLAGKEIIL